MDTEYSCLCSDMDTEYIDNVYVQIWIPRVQILFIFRYGYRVYRHCLCSDMDTECIDTVYVQIWIPSV